MDRKPRATSGFSHIGDPHTGRVRAYSPRMTGLWQDARFGFRTIFKDRGFFLTAVLALALGIGSTTAIFSVVYNVLLDPLPYKDGKNLFCPEYYALGTGRYVNTLSVAAFLDFRQGSRIFSDSMGIYEESVLLNEGGLLKEFDADRVTGNAFQFLGMPALIGRGLLPRDAEPGAPPVFVLNYRVWKQDFNLDPQVIGKTFNLDGTPTTLVGVMPRRFSFWDGNLWRPMLLDRADKQHPLIIYGHLRRGVTPHAAAAEILPLVNRLAKVYPNEFPQRFRIQLASLIEETVRDYRKTIYTLVGAVGLLLLIACANVSNLLLAKATAREKELAIRMSLGSGRGRVVRQLLVESLLLALSGAAAGCFLAWAGLKGLNASLPMWMFPDEAVISENTPVMLATVAVAMMTGILFGLVPALSASHRDINEILKMGSRGNSGSRRGRMRNLLIVSEVALSLLLLTTSGLLMRSFVRQQHIDLGIRSDHLLTTRLSLPAPQYKSTVSQVRFLRELEHRIAAHPGVISAGIATDLLPYSTLSTEIDVPGATHREHWVANMAGYTRQMFPTLGIRLLAGRLLTEADENGRRRVVLINQTMAAKYFRGQNPVGQRVLLTALKNAAEPVDNPWFEIVGVVSDSKNDGTRKEVSPEAFLPYTIEGFGTYELYVRTVGKPDAMIPELTTTILSMSPSVIPQYAWTMDRVLEVTEYSRPRFFTLLLGVFAIIGLSLVTVGVYSVISYTVSQQRLEMGIRMALGASPGSIRSHVVSGSLRFVCFGAVAGILLTISFSRVIASQVWGVAWYDPVTIGAVLVLLVSVGVLAAWIPSVRASRVAPIVCLQDQ